jgi:hypothetical protein
MKILKIAIIAVVTMFTFGAAQAQVRVRATIGARPVHHRTVVVRQPAYHRTVVVHRGPVYHRGYRRPYYRHRRY